jgi:hypothetical protein
MSLSITPCFKESIFSGRASVMISLGTNDLLLPPLLSLSLSLSLSLPRHHKQNWSIKRYSGRKNGLARDNEERKREVWVYISCLLLMTTYKGWTKTNV